MSIIVPARNAASVIDNCVRSITRTRYARYEVVLVDEGSTDNTAELMASFAVADPRIKVLRHSHGGRAAARNLGARHAAGDVLMFVDADAIFCRCTVDRMLQGFEDRRTGAVYGDDWPARWNRGRGGLLAALSHLGTGMTRRVLAAGGGLPFLPGGIEAFPSKVLAEIGPFREGAADAELELAWRVCKAGYRVGFAPRVRIQAASSSTLRELWRLRSRRTRGLLHTVAAHTGTPWPGFLLRHRWLVPLVPVYSLFTAVFMLAGLVRHVRGLAGRRDKQSHTTSAGPGADRDDDAWRALREAWA
ncbi:MULTISPECIES: glycosyltransferase family 2 protein [unclassified Arthrobacter]|uniref:glycosyltransferase n=1 Tax=unclassified Arthrobacter TaxID=235627 RepID=UPI0027D84923|nr:MULTISPECIES: glycosyltransferase family 2 protein [unclassified Arthrobacter]